MFSNYLEDKGELFDILAPGHLREKRDILKVERVINFSKAGTSRHEKLLKLSFMTSEGLLLECCYLDACLFEKCVHEAAESVLLLLNSIFFADVNCCYVYETSIYLVYITVSSLDKTFLDLLRASNG
ncbi:unnamed protein product [Linum trigynum]|uniref:Uncharacterized protein n=1 Tax=Linum trigynum TaxID=586398 RepID=A0AAV2GU93_9ROSI